MTTPNRPPLSPAAQAVMIAATNGNINVVNDPVYKQCIAAALRAVADWDETLFDVNEELMPPVRAVRTDRIIAIADELEETHD